MKKLEYENKFYPEQIERFWSKVDKKSDDECWEWLAGHKGKEGYGGFYINQIRNTINSHKVMFCIIHNFWIDEIPHGIVIRHKCNNPKCVNPGHLLLGTYQDNSQDMIDAGNSQKGEKSVQCKIYHDIAITIREKWKNGNCSYEDIAKEFNISSAEIYKIIKNKKYIDFNYDPEKYSKKTKVSDDDVEQIKKLRQSGVPVKEIANKFGLGTTQIYNISKEIQRRK